MSSMLARTTSTIFALTLASTALAHDIAPPVGDVDVRLVCERGCDEVRHRGQRYVAGDFGERYGISLTNRTGRWVEAVVSVDGRDVVDGLRISPRSRGYLLAPGQQYTVEGWRTSADAVAAFRFTSIGDSYVGRLGEGHNAGLVRVDVYPERAAPVRVRPAPRNLEPEAWHERDQKPRKDAAEREAPATQDRRGDDGRNLGTSYGETRWAPVEERDFVRADPDRPTRTVSIWYDDFEGLGARGIIPRRRPWVEDDHTPRWVPPPSRE